MDNRLSAGGERTTDDADASGGDPEKNGAETSRMSKAAAIGPRVVAAWNRS
jgi:hypothetical protein